MGISAWREAAAPSPSPSRLKPPAAADWRYRARQQKADCKHVVKEDRKAQQVLPVEEEVGGEEVREQEEEQ